MHGNERFNPADFRWSPRIDAGEGALQRSKKVPALIMRFSAGSPSSHDRML
jgi:hypothetical protein